MSFSQVKGAAREVRNIGYELVREANRLWRHPNATNYAVLSDSIDAMETELEAIHANMASLKGLLEQIKQAEEAMQNVPQHADQEQA